MEDFSTHPLVQPFWHQKGLVCNDYEHGDYHVYTYILEIKVDKTFDLTIELAHYYTDFIEEKYNYLGTWDILELKEDVLRLLLHYTDETGEPKKLEFRYNGQYGDYFILK